MCGRMGQLAAQYNAETIYVDETGLGGGLIDLARERGLPCRGVMFTLQEKADMYKNLRLLFENHNITLKQINKIVYQLSYLRREYTETGIMKKKSKKTPVILFQGLHWTTENSVASDLLRTKKEDMFR